MAVVTTRQLLEAGMHFGHQTRRWNPKMRRYILGERNGIYIIDLRKTLEGLEESYLRDVRDLRGRAVGVVLFVGTKKQTQGPVANSYARACGMPFVNERWLGGMLTNFSTISSRVGKLREFEAMERAGDFEAMPKKEGLRHRRELEKLRRNLGGIRDLDRLPEAIFVIDTKKEHIAVTEAHKLDLPIVAVVDTNCDPDVITYVIPGNDDAIRSGALMCRVMAEAVREGQWMAANRPTPPAEPAPARSGGRTPPRGTDPTRGSAGRGRPGGAAAEPAPSEPALVGAPTTAPPTATTAAPAASTAAPADLAAAPVASTAAPADLAAAPAASTAAPHDLAAAESATPPASTPATPAAPPASTPSSIPATPAAPAAEAPPTPPAPPADAPATDDPNEKEA